MVKRTEFEEGWDFAVQQMGSASGAFLSAQYVGAVQSAIRKLEKSINEHAYHNLGVQQLQGYMFEEFAAGTFNVDAAARGSGQHATVLHQLSKDSVDIAVTTDQQTVAEYSVKGYSTGAKSGVAQAKMTGGRSAYEGQRRLVYSDQLSDAQAETHRRSLLFRHSRPEVSEAYAETERNLTDRVATSDGTQSRPITRKEGERIAREGKRGEFSAEEHGVTVKSKIAPHMMKRALKAGLSAAAITIAFQMIPEMVKAIGYLAENGEFDIEHLSLVGENSLAASADAFVKGSIAAALQAMLQSGAFGPELAKLTPPVVGIVVAVVYQTVRNSILVARGKMTAREMGVAFADMVVTSTAFAGAAQVGGLIGQAIAPQLPFIGYMVGSLLGTSLCVAYGIGKKSLISFCVDTGFTCFGLVEQDYQLPKQVLDQIGIDTIEIAMTELEKTEMETLKIQTVRLNTVELATVQLVMVRRGIIGVNRVGYSLAG